MNQTSDLSVAVQKRLDAGQKIAAFWKDFGGPISLIGGGFFGGFSQPDNDGTTFKERTTFILKKEPIFNSKYQNYPFILL